MAKSKFYLGMLVLLLAFGMMVIGCENSDYSGKTEGTAHISVSETDQNRALVSGDGKREERLAEALRSGRITQEQFDAFQSRDFRSMRGGRKFDSNWDKERPALTEEQINRRQSHRDNRSL